MAAGQGSIRSPWAASSFPLSWSRRPPKTKTSRDQSIVSKPFTKNWCIRDIRELCKAPEIEVGWGWNSVLNLDYENLVVCSAHTFLTGFCPLCAWRGVSPFALGKSCTTSTRAFSYRSSCEPCRSKVGAMGARLSPWGSCCPLAPCCGPSCAPSCFPGAGAVPSPPATGSRAGGVPKSRGPTGGGGSACPSGYLAHLLQTRSEDNSTASMDFLIFFS